jgi:hypothetical protein
VILLGAIFLRPSEAYCQIQGTSYLAAAGSRPWAIYLPNRGYYAVWDNLVDAIHVRKVDLSGIPTTDTTSLLNTSASLSPRICANAHHAAIVWEDRLSNEISFFNTYIVGYVFNMDTLRGGTYVMYNDIYFDAIRGGQDVDFIDDTTLIVVWCGNGPSTISPQSGIYAQLYSTGGDFIGSNLLMTDHIQNGVNGIGPRVVAHAGIGYFFVTWVDNSMGSNRLFGRKFSSSGVPQAPSFLISDDSAMTDMFYYGTALDSSGGFVACWIADRDTVSRIEWRWYDRNGVPLSGSQSVSGDNKLFDSGNCIDVSIDDQNRTVLVWEQNTMKGSKILGQAFRADKSSFGKAFRVSSDTTANEEIFPRVIFRNNKVFTVWQSNGIQASIIDFEGIVSVRGYVKNQMPVGNYELYQCYPNPFNPSTTIRYALPERSHVTMAVFNTLGQQVATLVNENEEAGIRDVVFDGSGLASGVYFYRLRAGEYVQTRKLVVLK